MNTIRKRVVATELGAVTRLGKDLPTLWADVPILESLAHAQQRGAHVYVEVTGYGTSSDAFHITASDENGTVAVLSMERALRDAGLGPEDIVCINAHGTSTLLNDITETRAVHKVLGKHVNRVPVSSTKSIIGRQARKAHSRTALSNSFGFGGHNATLIFSG